MASVGGLCLFLRPILQEDQLLQQPMDWGMLQEDGRLCKISSGMTAAISAVLKILSVMADSHEKKERSLVVPHIKCAGVALATKLQVEQAQGAGLARVAGRTR